MNETQPLLENRHLEIKGERIIIVPFTDKHLYDPHYLSWLRDYEVMKYVGRPEYLNGNIHFSEVKRYVYNLALSSQNYFFAIETFPEREFIGTLKFGNIDWHRKIVDLGIIIGDRQSWGKGLASDAFRAAIHFCFEQCHFHKIVAGCSAANTAMCSVMKKVGFQEEGFFREQDLIEGKRYGHYHYGMLKNEYTLNKE